MRKALIFAAVAEAATGVALLLVPSVVGQLLLGETLAGIAIPVARVTGIVLIALGVACWPGPPAFGMLIYTAGAGLLPRIRRHWRQFWRRSPVACRYRAHGACGALSLHIAERRADTQPQRSAQTTQETKNPRNL